MRDALTQQRLACQQGQADDITRGPDDLRRRMRKSHDEAAK